MQHQALAAATTIQRLQQRVEELQTYKAQAADLQQRVEELQTYKTDAAQLQQRVEVLQPYKTQAAQLQQQVDELKKYQTKVDAAQERILKLTEKHEAQTKELQRTMEVGVKMYEKRIKELESTVAQRTRELDDVAKRLAVLQTSLHQVADKHRKELAAAQAHAAQQQAALHEACTALEDQRCVVVFVVGVGQAY